MEPELKTLNDYYGILKRRRWSLILPVLIIFTISIIAALILPPTYRSTATILIEEQEIPREFVVATVTSFAEQRIQTINQTIMSTTRLLGIINRFNLYTDLRNKLTTEEIAAKMRKRIKFEAISADVIDRRTGRPTAATIAFSLSFEGDDPQQVFQVTNVLSSLYLEENLKTREQQTQGTSKFLAEEATALQQQLSGIDRKIADFKERNIHELPELLQVNLQGLDRTDREMDQLKDQLRTLKEKEGYLQVQLISIPTDAANQDRTLLKELKAKLVQLQSRASDKHPDVIKTRVEIAELEKRLNVAPAKQGIVTDGNQADNPAYITLASQLASTQSDIESVKRQVEELNKRREGYLKRLESSPRVEESYKALTVERNNTQLKYDDMMKKSMEAKVAQGLEKGQMGERFTLIDPARLPEKPVKPNIPAILLIGLFLGAGAGIGLTSLKEFNDRSTRSSIDLEKATSLPVLTDIPEIITWKELDKKKKRRRILLTGIVLAIIIGLLVFHFLIMDFDILWIKIMRRMTF